MIKNLLADATETPKGNGVMTYVLLGGIILVIILMFAFNTIQRKRAQKEANDKLSSLKIGDKIKTIGMIVGEIVELCDDGTIVLLTGSEKYPSYIRIEKMAIYLINPEPTEMPNSKEVFDEIKEVSVENSENDNSVSEISNETTSNNESVSTEEVTEANEPVIEEESDKKVD